MAVTQSALIRYKTIDRCIRDEEYDYTLDDLMEECSQALQSQLGIEKKVGKRTLQLDLELLRSKEAGYEAPIIVHKRKFYKYQDPDFQIFKQRLCSKDIETIKEIANIIEAYREFDDFDNSNEVQELLKDFIPVSKKESLPKESSTSSSIDENSINLDQCIEERTILTCEENSSFLIHGEKLVGNTLYFLIENKGSNKFIYQSDVELKNATLSDEQWKSTQELEASIVLSRGFQLGTETNTPISIELWVDKKGKQEFLNDFEVLSPKDNGASGDGNLYSIDVIWGKLLEEKILGYGEIITIDTPLNLKKKIEKRFQKALKNYKEGREQLSLFEF